MLGRRNAATCVGLGVLVAALAGCTEHTLNVVVENDDGVLAQRVRTPGTRVPVDGSELPLTLVAEADAPEWDGSVLQATSVVLIGDTALVTYNTKGDARMGALETYRIDRSGDGPEITLTSQAIFPDAEVHSASFDGDGRVFATGATDDPSFVRPAVVDAFDFEGGDLFGDRRMGLDSYAATGSVAVPGAVLVTTGSDGSLLALDPRTLQGLDGVALHDARWVDVQGNTAAVVQGTPGVMAMFGVGSIGTDDAFSMFQAGATALPGLDEEGHKSTVDIAGRRAFVASGYAGTTVVDLATGAVEATVGLPDVPEVAVEFVVTNAASASCDLLFMSDGGAGVFVASLTGSGELTGGRSGGGHGHGGHGHGGGWDDDDDSDHDENCDEDHDDDDDSDAHADDDDSSDDDDSKSEDDDSKSEDDDSKSDDDDSKSDDDDSKSDDDDSKSDDDDSSGDEADDDKSEDCDDEACDDDDKDDDDDTDGPGWTCAVDAPELAVTTLGGLRFDGPVSTNHVAFDGEYLFVAAGKGGLKVVRLDEDAPTE